MYSRHLIDCKCYQSPSARQNKASWTSAEKKHSQEAVKTTSDVTSYESLYSLANLYNSEWQTASSLHQIGFFIGHLGWILIVYDGCRHRAT